MFSVVSAINHFTYADKTSEVCYMQTMVVKEMQRVVTLKERLMILLLLRVLWPVGVLLTGVL